MDITQTGTETTEKTAASPAAQRPSVPWVAVAAFVAIAYGLAWTFTTPIWHSGGLANPNFLAYGLAMMFTPAISALIVTFWLLKPSHPARFLGLVPLRPWRRVVGYSLLGFVGVQALCLAAVLLGSVLGVAPLAITSSTASTLLTAPLLSLVIAVAAFGEELGWRGFLLPALRPLGTWPALLIMGVVWGLWHAPLILLGYNYGRTDAIGLVLMCVTTVLVGILFGWLRMRSASVYPSCFAHGALNASAGIFTAALLPQGFSGIASSPLGWVGWSLLALCIVATVAARSFRWADPVPALPAVSGARVDRPVAEATSLR